MKGEIKMKKTDLLFKNILSLALLTLIICLTSHQLIRSGVYAISMFENSEGVIAFQTERHGTNEEIYIMNADGSGQTRLTFNNYRDVCPSISPDGQKIVFSSNRDGDYEIYVMNRNGSNQTRLTTSVGFDLHPDWSPDGTKIAFFSERDGNYEIYVMEANGSNQTRLTFNTWQDQLPDWLPNSSPDSLKILFTSDESGTYGIYKMNADGTDIQVVNDGPIQELMGRWSPDGSKIIFVKMIDWNSQRDVWRMDCDGSNEIQLTTNPAIDEDANWSPDGTKLVFQSDRNGLYQLFTMNPDGSEQTVIQNSQGDYWPTWGIDTTQTGIDEDQESMFGFTLFQNYPNPFNPSTRIDFEIVKPGFVSLKIFNLFGQEVDELINNHMPSGLHSVIWNSKNLPVGIYYYRLTNHLGSDTKKMVKTGGI
jgi:Tol biopolymer transport system component